MSSRRSLPESGQGIVKGQSDEVPSQEHKKFSQNPIFTVYQGYRPSAISTWSADSLDGTLPSTSAISAAGQSLHQNRQNPIFVEYEGHQLSTDSASVNKSKTFPQSTSEGAHNVHAMCSTGRRPSATSIIIICRQFGWNSAICQFSLEHTVSSSSHYYHCCMWIRALNPITI